MAKKKTTTTLPKVKNVTSQAKLPTLYIGFPDDVKKAIKRIAEIEDRLISRGYKPVKPYDIYRLTVRSNKVPKGKKSSKVKRDVPSVMLAFRLEKV